MLQNIRDNIQGTAAKVVIALIVVPFALFGIDSLFNTSSQTPAAVVNGEKISQQALAQAVALQKRRLLNMMGDNIDPSMLDDSLLRQPALDALIKQQLLLQVADEAGMTVSNQQLNNLIVTMPQFMEDGRFSQQRYEQILRFQGYSSAFFKQMLRSDLTVQQVSDAIAGSSFVTEAQLQQAAKLLHETRDFQYITVPLAPIESGLKVSDAEVSTWYQANSQQYLSDEKVRFSYIELDEAQFIEPVSEQDIEREYQSVIESSQVKTEREVAHILFEQQDGESAEALAARIAKVQAELAGGADFAALAKANSSDLGSAEEGGVLGFTSGDSFPESFEAALLDLNVGDVSAPVVTDAGTHLIKLLSVREPELPSLAEMRDEIKARLEHQNAQPKLIAAVEELRDLVFNAEGLVMPAKELGLEVQQSSVLSRSETSGLFAHESVRKAAFNAELREQKLNSEVLELSEGQYLVLHVDEYQAPEALPLEQVREQIVKAIKRDNAFRLAEEKAKSLAEKLAAGQSAEKLAKDEVLSWEAVIDAKRNKLGVDSNLLKKVFSMTKPLADAHSVATLKQDNGDWVAVSLIDVEPGQLQSIDGTVRKELQNTLANSQASKQFSAYFNSLWSNAEVKIN
ncbi:SurA N-terminal domain-containing protein [Spongiibacter sp. KMU-158]|uniref:Periplasmic chaperone PpiD n=1 Tax=Spongiibacter pelagi TaxID=2760804 RepID=A0A927GWP5_9GAMM|nr:SurA N-terminal domain-containing protein [Spongiibacter pelagi]MBD2859685.1 SurA N-terminal domain-containing protein [Spongiibacter pelagi]